MRIDVGGGAHIRMPQHFLSELDIASLRIDETGGGMPEGTDWVKNVLAAGECRILTRGRSLTLTRPEVIVDPTRGLVPAPIRFIGRLGNVTEFLRMRPETAQGQRLTA